MLRQTLNYNKFYITAIQSQFLKTCIQPVKTSIRRISAIHSVPVNITQNIPRRYYSETFKVEEITVDYDHVRNAINNTKIFIVDVREPEEVKEYGKIPNSINIPCNVSTALGTMSEREFENLYKKPKPMEDSEIIFYCMIGKRSGMAQQNAINLGYKNADRYWFNKKKPLISTIYSETRGEIINSSKILNMFTLDTWISNIKYEDSYS